jgi:processive 1,2-diacylglycerol beta-glucosyltransferase
MSASLRLLILTSSTGGGHNARAHALKARTLHYHPEAQVLIHKTLENTHPFYAFGVAFYNRIQKYAPILHHLYFHALETLSLHKKASAILGRTRFLNVVENFQPHIVVSVHAHTNHGYFDLIRASKVTPTPLCATYCGELTGGYGFSHLWINPHADLFIGATPETCQAAIKLGMPNHKTLHGAFLLDPRFFHCSPPSRVAFLQSLGLTPDRFTLLITASGTGANQHKKILQALRSYPHPLQLIFLCGKNQKQIAHLNTFSTPQQKIVALPHSTQMPTLLRSVDAVITRPGSGTTSEAILVACPIIHHTFGGIMPQESLTVRYCVQHGLSLYASNSQQMRVLFKRIGKDLSLLQHIREAQKQCFQSDPLKLLSFLLEQLKKHHRSSHS